MEEELVREKEARKEGMRRRKPAFAAQEKTDEELKGYSQLNLDLNKGSGVKAVESAKVKCLFMKTTKFPFSSKLIRFFSLFTEIYRSQC